MIRKILTLSLLFSFSSICLAKEKSFRHYLSPFYRGSECFHRFEDRGLGKNKARSRGKKAIYGIQGSLSTLGAVAYGFVFVNLVDGATVAIAAGVGAAIGGGIPLIALAPVTISALVGLYISKRIDKSAFVLETITCATGDDCKGKRLKRAWQKISKVHSSVTLEDVAMTVARGTLSGEVCQLKGGKLPGIKTMRKWATKKLGDKSFRPQRIEIQEKEMLYSSFVIHPFKAMAMVPPKSRFKFLEKFKLKKYKKKVLTEKNAIERLLRDIAVMEGFHKTVNSSIRQDFLKLLEVKKKAQAYLKQLESQL